MSKHSETFLLHDQEQQERLKVLAESPSDSLESERLLCKLAAEQAMNSGAYGLAAMICATIAKISSTEIQNRIKTGDLISRDQAFALVRTIVEAVTEEIEGKFPNWEDSLARIGERLEGSMKKPLQLEHQP